MMQRIFGYFEPFSRNVWVWQTDGRTDILVEHAMLNCIAQLKMSDYSNISY